jgi:hypothetical protein
MQAALREVKSGRRQALATLLLPAVCMLPFSWMPARTQAAEAAMTVELPAGKFKVVRLRNLPKETVMAVRIQSTGKLFVILLNEEDSKRFPKPEEPVFAGSADRRLSFTVSIPATGTYFLVLDNRRGIEAQKIKFAIRAERGRARPDAPAPSQPPGTDPAPRRLEGA